MKIFPTSSIKELDAYTIENETIDSIDLMERASQALADAIAERWEEETPFTVFAGPGTTVETRWPSHACWRNAATGWPSICSTSKENSPPIVQRTKTVFSNKEKWTSTK